GSPRVDKRTAGKAHYGPQVALVHQLALGLDKGRFALSEQKAIVEDNRAVAARGQLTEKVLYEEYLCAPGREAIVLLRVLALFAAEGRIGQDHVERLRGLVKQGAVAGTAGQCVSVPEIWLVDAVQDEVRQSDGKRNIVFLPAEEGVVFEPIDVGAARRVTQ